MVSNEWYTFIVAIGYIVIKGSLNWYVSNFIGTHVLLKTLMSMPAQLYKSSYDDWVTIVSWRNVNIDDNQLVYDSHDIPWHGLQVILGSWIVCCILYM